jgi:signal transduction histidine kinase
LELIDLVNLNLKYARADKASVFLEQKGSAVRITVKDNGIGFNPDQVKRNVSSDGDRFQGASWHDHCSVVSR